MNNKDKQRCEYCASSKHTSKQCGLGKFARGEKKTLAVGAIVDGMDNLFKAIEIEHEIRKIKENP